MSCAVGRGSLPLVVTPTCSQPHRTQSLFSAAMNFMRLRHIRFLIVTHFRYFYYAGFIFFVLILCSLIGCCFTLTCFLCPPVVPYTSALDVYKLHQNWLIEVSMFSPLNFLKNLVCLSNSLMGLTPSLRPYAPHAFPLLDYFILLPSLPSLPGSYILLRSPVSGSFFFKSIIMRFGAQNLM